jgi:hypothetical protein
MRMILRRSLLSFNVDSREPLHVRRTSGGRSTGRDDNSRRKVRNVAADSCALYSNVNGVWSVGTSATATRLP